MQKDACVKDLHQIIVTATDGQPHRIGRLLIARIEQDLENGQPVTTLQVKKPEKLSSLYPLKIQETPQQVMDMLKSPPPEVIWNEALEDIKAARVQELQKRREGIASHYDGVMAGQNHSLEAETTTMGEEISSLQDQLSELQQARNGRSTFARLLSKLKGDLAKEERRMVDITDRRLQLLAQIEEKKQETEKSRNRCLEIKESQVVPLDKELASVDRWAQHEIEWKCERLKRRLSITFKLASAEEDPIKPPSPQGIRELERVLQWGDNMPDKKAEEYRQECDEKEKKEAERKEEEYRQYLQLIQQYNFIRLIWMSEREMEQERERQERERGRNRDRGREM